MIITFDSNHHLINIKQYPLVLTQFKLLTLREHTGNEKVDCNEKI